MNRNLAASVVALAGSAVGVGAWCAVAAPGSPGDPLGVPELAGGAVLTAWLLLAARILVRGARLGRDLDQRSIPFHVAGVGVRVLPPLGPQAFVLGWLRPRIYVSSGLLDRLDDDEVLAVLRHEEHHRRRRAPLRAAGLEAWASLTRPLGPVRQAVADRLAELEIEADRAAIEAGSSPSTIARALLKTDGLHLCGASFTSSAERRIRWLLGNEPLAPERAPGALPYEWLPVVGFGLFVVACHVAVGTLS